MQISDNKYVTVTYDLNVGEGEERELMERATAQQPLELFFGTIPCSKHSRINSGLSQGDKFSFRLTPKRLMVITTTLKYLNCPKIFSRSMGKSMGKCFLKEYPSNDGFFR
jgi:FKBP-type peptidyl-prolyl cis-trans isomerase SlyD